MKRNKQTDYKQFHGKNPFGSQAKLLLHYERLVEYLQKGDTTPIFMEINPTNKCNLACRWCINEDARGNETLEIGALEKYFSDFSEMGGKAITFSGGGEPTMYPDFERAVISAKKNYLDLGLMTNGVFEEKLIKTIGDNFKWVRFSVDTLNQKNYKKGKGVDRVERVKNNVESLKDYPVKVGVNCNIGEEFTLEDARGLVEWVGTGSANYLQFRPILPRFFKNEKPELNFAVWEYLDSLKGKVDFLNLSGDKRGDLSEGYIFPFRSCEGHFFEPILDATGEVKVCIYHSRDSRFTFGNIHQKSFKEIWSSEERKKTIDFVRNLDYQKNCQMCCKLAEPNKLIDFLLHPEEMPDKNFL